MKNFYYDTIYLLNAIGLTPGGSNTEHICIETVHRKNNENGIYRTEQT